MLSCDNWDIFLLWGTMGGFENEDCFCSSTAFYLSDCSQSNSRTMLSEF